jgi:hypothetical protein
MMQKKRPNSDGNVSNYASKVGVKVLGAGKLTIDKRPYHQPETHSIATEYIMSLKRIRAFYLSLLASSDRSSSISAFNASYSPILRRKNLAVNAAFSAMPLGVNK